MTSMGMTDADYAEFDDAAEYDDSAGEFADSDLDSDFEDFDAESPASRRAAQRRRVAAARARRVALRGQAQARRTGMAARPPIKSAASAIKRLDLETKVADDSFRRAVVAQGKRMSRGEYAAVTGAAVAQFMESFQAPANPYFRAALRFSPLLLLAPQRKGTGFEGVVKDPRVFGAAAVAGITLLGENRNRFTNARDIDITGPQQLAQGTRDVLIGDVLDGNGRVLSGQAVKWSSSDPSVVRVDPATGALRARRKAGPAIITAEYNGIVRRLRLTVT